MKIKGNKFKVIDGGVFVGMDTKTTLSTDILTILKKMDANHIDRALVASLAAVNSCEEEGNGDVLKYSKSSPKRIIPMAVVSPFAFIPGTGAIKKLAKQGFKIVAAFPLYQSWPADIHVFRKMAQEIAREKMILQVAVSNWQELANARSLAEIVETPVLIRWVRGGGYLYTTEEIALAQDFKNLYFDVGNLTTTGGIRQLVEHVGAHRLYFSSNMPLTYERSIYYNIWTEDLSSEDRAMISGGTLEKVLGL